MSGTAHSNTHAFLSRFLPWVATSSYLVAVVTVLMTTPTANAGLAGLERLQTGLDLPVFVTHAPGDNERLFIVQKSGAIRILDLATNTINAQNFLTVGNLVSGGESGLLGLAFHPDYQSNGRFFVYATLNDGGVGSASRSHVLGYTVSGNPDIANTTPTDIIAWDQPQSNHNGGWIGFGPNDGYMYVMFGDGGNSDDTGTGHTSGTGNAQDITNNFLGKALRIDVNGTSAPGGNYDIPSDNPFVDVTGDDEIWAYGLRNPWRASFDRQTGDLWIADVGQDAWEEVDFQPATSSGGENYGWRVLEGTQQNPVYPGEPAPPGAVGPVYEYDHTAPPGDDDFEGNSIFGGYVYRGPDPELQGTYFFGDSVSGNLWSFDPNDPSGTVDNINTELTPNVGSLNALVSFGEDAVGNLYILDIASSLFGQAANTGELYRVVTDAVVTGDFNGDGKVNSADLALWEAGYGTLSGAELSDGDADEDGDVDGDDFLLWQRNSGATAQDSLSAVAAPQSIPEPATVLLALLGLGTGAISLAQGKRKRLVC